MTKPATLNCHVGFNAQHSPMGAFMSFTCGNFGTRGGIGLQIGQPGDQEVFIGFKDGDRYSDATLKCLPFYTAAVDRSADAFLVEQAGPAEQNVKPDAVAFTEKEIARAYGWASDRWVADGLSFTVYSPFGAIPDPAVDDEQRMREGLLPAVIARLELDNTAGKETKTAMFALNHARTGSRILNDDLGSGRVAWAFRREAGGAAELRDFTSSEEGSKIDAEPFIFMRWSASDGVRERYNPVHLLGSCPGFGFEVPAGKKYGITIALGSYLEGFQTNGLDGRYLYTRYFKGLGDVLKMALDNSAKMIASAEALDSKLAGTALSEDQKFMISHATHSYYGSTQLLEIGELPFWVVNEGEYCMMNTLDLSVDHVFWELEHNPWLVRNLLDNFVRLYSYNDEVKVYKSEFAPSTETMQMDPSQTPPPPDEAQLKRPYETKPGGISFCHDMGAHNNFSPKGRSSYELANLTGCFSYMTVEQLCNWSLTAGCYVAKTRDLEWLKANKTVVDACLASMIHRSGDVGFAQFDSTRCIGGQEITTYDSLDHSLAQTRNNVYIAVKSWGTYKALALMFRELGDAASQAKCEELAAKVAAVVADQAVDGVLPAIFEKSNPGYGSRILPAIEGCMYPLYFVNTGFAGCTLDQVYSSPAEKRMFDVLEEHTRNLLLDPERRNLFADGGIKLSSTSNNSWMSKISIFMHVTRKVFHLDEDPRVAEVLRNADAAHVKWQTEGSSYWACCDQIVSGEGKASRYYPRIITSALWME
ncbi:glycoside hydrolase family 52 protein [Occallatibacter riparius]|uniref:Glycoside hydrolase family 52 protein n=1 Tax=Occallatibacter riparius TaxID=1002689 RepID=A0A9J7BRU0_9BACT|nr:glycoside hydrolase family 52 protein [Occallatibacter riparius]UWZ84490.1 glycoside hydrolase family 52 protein [Occallatibacter riparius]